MLPWNNPFNLCNPLFCLTSHVTQLLDCWLLVFFYFTMRVQRYEKKLKAESVCVLKFQGFAKSAWSPPFLGRALRVWGGTVTPCRSWRRASSQWPSRSLWASEGWISKSLSSWCLVFKDPSKPPRNGRLFVLPFIGELEGGGCFHFFHSLCSVLILVDSFVCYS